MVNPKNKVVISGMAWTTALGDDLDGVWKSLTAGMHGFTDTPSKHKLRNTLVSRILKPEFSECLSDRMQQISLHTVKNALKDAGISNVKKRRIWLILGTSFGARLDDKQQAVISLHEWTKQIADKLGFGNRCLSVSTACSSGSDAVLLGTNLIRSGIADICLCGGVDLATENKRLAHSTLKTMSPTYLKAFDAQHDGTLLGEGAGILVLESEVHAKNRGQRAYAYIRGCGSANDAFGLTAPDPEGKAAKLAIYRSLMDAQLNSDEVGLYNAHGSGTQINDVTETNALKDIFKKNLSIIVFATKGAFGHTLGATGAIEAIALILALRNQKVPPIVGLENPQHDFPFTLPLKKELPCKASIGLSLTLGFGGFDTSLIFEGI